MTACRLGVVCAAALLGLGVIPCGAHGQTFSGGGTVNATPSNRPEPFAERTLLTEALTKAGERAGPEDKRILAIWGKNKGEFTPKLFTVMQAPDTAKMLAIDYEVVWVNIAEGPHAADNMAVTGPFEIEIQPTSQHPMLSVHSADGQVIARQSAQTMLDTERPGQYSPLKLQDFLHANKPKHLSAKDVMEKAATDAKAAGKSVFVRFYEFGDGWADRFEALLARPEVARAIANVAKPIRLHGQRNEGMFDVLTAHVPKAQGYPIYAMLAPDGKTLALSQPEGKPNIGFPTGAAETDAFIALLNAGTVKLSADDEKAVRAAIAAENAPKATSEKPPASTPAPKP